MAARWSAGLKWVGPTRRSKRSVYRSYTDVRLMQREPVQQKHHGYNSAWKRHTGTSTPDTKISTSWSSGLRLTSLQHFFLFFFIRLFIWANTLSGHFIGNTSLISSPNHTRLHKIYRHASSLWLLSLATGVTFWSQKCLGGGLYFTGFGRGVPYSPKICSRKPGSKSSDNQQLTSSF